MKINFYSNNKKENKFMVNWEISTNRKREEQKDEDIERGRESIRKKSTQKEKERDDSIKTFPQN